MGSLRSPDEGVTQEGYPRPPMRHLRTLFACLLAASLVPACSSGGSKQTRQGRKAQTDQAAAEEAALEKKRLGDSRRVAVSDLTPGEREEITRAWSQFVNHSPLWRISLRSLVERGGAAPYVLSENLFLHFFKASLHGAKAEINRVAGSVRVIGEPAVAYFAKPLVEDLVPLGRAVVAEVTDPTNPEARIKKTFHHFQIDDFTRRDAARVLAAIGAPAVPMLASDKLLKQARPSGRRYAAFALGRIGDDAAVAALSGMLDSAEDWQDRAAAAKGLGAALTNNPAARAPLERASTDADPFVRKKAGEALAGRTRLPF